MEEIYRLLIEFKAAHPLKFWTTIFLVTSIVIISVWKLQGRNKR